MLVAPVKRWTAIMTAALLAAVVTLFAVCRHRPSGPLHSVMRVSQLDYVDPAVCARCHQDIAELVATGHVTEAITEYKRVLALRPGRPQAHLGLGTVPLSQGWEPTRGCICKPPPMVPI